MPIFLDALGLAYFDAPKCACTTVKLALYEIEKGAPFAGSADAEGRGIHAYWADRGFGHGGAPVTEAEYDRAAGLWSFAVVRDPVQRLVSAYSNRVRHFGELRRGGAERAARAAAMDLTLDPDFDTFVARLNDYRALDPSIAHHTRPLTHFLGPDPSRLGAVYPRWEMPRLEAELSARTGRTVAFGRAQTGGGAFKPTSIAPRTWDRLAALTAADYAAFEGILPRPDALKVTS